MLFRILRTGDLACSASSNDHNLFRRDAYFIDKILKGVKPAYIPVEWPNLFEIIMNLKTARSLGVKIRGSIMMLADKVIE